MNEQYRAFLESKIATAPTTGTEIDPSEVNPMLKPHQRDIVVWALRGGKRAIFAAFGLGKSVIQIEIIRLLAKHLADEWQPGSSVAALIVLPLGVRQEFKRDAEMLAKAGPQYAISFRFIRKSEEVTPDHQFYLTNYESVRDGKLSPDLFSVVSLDEASCLRSSGSKTYHSFLEMFAAVPFRFVATATPSPNDFIELLNYAGFLGIADKSALKTRYFNRDSQNANNLTLRDNMREEFWTWVHSWAVFLQKPSDLGYSDEGYDMPPLDVRYHEIPSDHGKGQVPDGRGQFALFRDAAAGITQAASEKRDSLPGRVEKMMEIVAEAGEDEHFILWHDQEREREAIQAALPEAVSVWGTQDLDERERRIIAFSEGEFRFLSTKPVIAGSGCNFQRHCHRAVFLGIGYKFNDFIQAIHRILRFQQAHPCRIDVIYTEAERPILAALQDKWRKHDETVAAMGAIIREFGLGVSGLQDRLKRRMHHERTEVVGKAGRYVAVNADTIPETASMADDSIDSVITSIPFGTQYEYTDCFNDLGHNEDHDGFFRQMDFLTPNLLRILKPGRMACIHVKDRVNFGAYSGYGFSSIEPFHMHTIANFLKHGFVYCGMMHIDTDVVKENNQTYRLGWTEVCKDGTKMGVGSPEYVLLFRKKPSDLSNSYADMPVEKEKAHYTRARWQIDAHAHWKSSGMRLLGLEEIAELHPEMIPRAWAVYSIERPYSYADHVRLSELLEERGKLSSNFMMLPTVSGEDADDIWTDVVRQLTLNGSQTQRGLNNHICPLQFDIVDRLIDRYTNPGETVYDPFAGIATVPYRAVKMGRIGRGTELNEQYFKDGLHYLNAAEAEASAPSLFDAFDATPEGLPCL